MRYLLILVAVMSLTSCKWFQNKPACELTTTYTNVAGARVADFLECSNPAAVSKSIQDTIEKLNLCEKPIEAGMASAVVCRPVAMVVSNWAVTGLPTEWGCTGGTGVKLLEQAIYSACSAIPF